MLLTVYDIGDGITNSTITSPVVIAGGDGDNCVTYSPVFGDAGVCGSCSPCGIIFVHASHLVKW